MVSALFKALDANKSSIDIPNKLIKLAADPLSEPFTQIYYMPCLIRTGNYQIREFDWLKRILIAV